MAKKQSNGVPDFMKDRLVVAEKRLVAFEQEAQKLLSDLVSRGKKSRKEIQSLIRRASELGLSERAEELKDRAEKTGGEVVRRLETLQDRALGLVGVASQAQVEELSSELEKLSRKIERLAKEAKGKPSKAKRASAPAA